MDCRVKPGNDGENLERERNFSGVSGTDGAGQLRDTDVQAGLYRSKIRQLIRGRIQRLRR